MNSIKNAIVTVTLLTVGYGSYVVLQDPSAGQLPNYSQNSVAAPNAAAPELDTPNLEIEVVVPEAELASMENSPLSSSFDAQPPAAADPRERTTSIEPSASVGLNSTPELPPLPELIKPVRKNLTDPKADLAAPEKSQPNTPATVSTDRGSDREPWAANVAPPVATLVGPSNLGSDSNAKPNPAGPFADPVVVEQINVQATPKVAVSKINTSASKSLNKPTGVIPPFDPSIGGVSPQNDENGSPAFERVWTEVQQYLGANDLPAALKTLTPWCSELELSKEQESRCMRLLDELAGTVIYSRESHLEPAHEVQAGQTLDEIAATYEVPQEMLAKINGIAPPHALTTGEKIKILRGPFRASVSLFKSQLTLFMGPHYAGRFPVTIGRDLPPEPAFYEVAEKSNGRNYFDRRLGREILRSKEGNRYGDHWLGLRGEHITTGHSVGIHGRPLQFSADDIGSISLDPIDAEDVYSILSLGSQIEIQP